MSTKYLQKWYHINNSYIKKMIKVTKVGSCKVKNSVYEEYHISGFDRGYGNTIGNALRRTIIGYTPGIAVYAMKFSCFKHEFDYSGHVLEDANEILGRIKNVIIKYDDDFIVDANKEYKFEIKGGSCFKAGDIKIEGLVICNPDYELFNVVEGYDVTFSILLKRFHGFVLNKQNGSQFDVNSGFIGVTSVYSKISSVTYSIMDKNVSFGDDDKIILKVQHESVYNIGFILLTALKNIVNVTSKIEEAYQTYIADFRNNVETRVKIISEIEDKYGIDIVAVLEKLEFNSYTELDLHLSKLTYRKCKLTKENFHDLCNFVKEKIDNETQN